MSCVVANVGFVKRSIASWAAAGSDSGMRGSWEGQEVPVCLASLLNLLRTVSPAQKHNTFYYAVAFESNDSSGYVTILNHLLVRSFH